MMRLNLKVKEVESLAACSAKDGGFAIFLGDFERHIISESTIVERNSRPLFSR